MYTLCSAVVRYIPKMNCAIHCELLQTEIFVCLASVWPVHLGSSCIRSHARSAARVQKYEPIICVDPFCAFHSSTGPWNFNFCPLQKSSPATAQHHPLTPFLCPCNIAAGFAGRHAPQAEHFPGEVQMDKEEKPNHCPV